MAGIAQKKYERLYTLHVLIPQKADKEKISPEGIKLKIAKILGISIDHTYKIINASPRYPRNLNPSQLLKLQKFFNLDSINDLLNKDLHTSSTQAGTRVKRAGSSSKK